MPVFQSFFGGSRGDDLISFSSLNTRVALDGFPLHSPLFTASGKGPRNGTPPATLRIKSEKTTEQHIFKADLQGLGIEDVKVKVEGGVLRLCGEQRTPKGMERRWHGGERGSSSFRHRIPLPDDADADETRSVVRKGVLIITVPRKAAQKVD